MVAQGSACVSTIHDVQGLGLGLYDKVVYMYHTVTHTMYRGLVGQHCGNTLCATVIVCLSYSCELIRGSVFGCL